MTDKQAFIRLLKELGIYKVYMDDLKLATSGKHKIVDYNNHTFSYLMDRSFTWDDTRHYELYWHLSWADCAHNLPIAILNNEYIRELLRQIVNAYINVTNKPGFF